jgi:hypothetical protein
MSRVKRLDIFPPIPPSDQTHLQSLTRAIKAQSNSGTTSERPNAVQVGAGATFFDTTLVKPIWSDGTVWRDATGTAV